MDRTLGVALVFLALLGGIGSGVLAAHVGGLALSPRNIVVDLNSELNPPKITYIKMASVDSAASYDVDWSSERKQFVYTPQVEFRRGGRAYLLITYEYMFDEDEIALLGSGTIGVDGGDHWSRVFHQIPVYVNISNVTCVLGVCSAQVDREHLPLPVPITLAKFVLRIWVFDSDGQHVTYEQHGVAFRFEQRRSIHGQHLCGGLTVREGRAPFRFYVPRDLAPGVYTVKATVEESMTEMSSSMTMEIVVEGI
ncbi:MAG: hypothetical protein ACE5KH_01380 [Candidatus Geothermarchaeales archaeon]